ncbi:MAG: molybdopterin-dependent oxidoreductase [Bacteroidales bacterium]|nr:molybdopterin-dependent oxidoreductase [Bacteroidales bacterium]
MSEKLNIFLNEKKVTGFKGETILQAANRHGIEIPTLCNDPRLEPYSSCFVCVVEVEGMRGLQPSCSTKINEGMSIHTDNEKVRKSRKTALDLLLSNHYADCSAPCKQTCPAGVDVQGYISLIEKGLYIDAIALIKETNPLPAICGRVCVRPCEVACRRNLLDEGTAVGIDYMKRFSADYDLYSKNKYVPAIAKSTGKKIAIIGAGPGGLSCAYFLQQKGHQCDIYEAAPNPGGWLRYGIPEYRLPNDLLQKEIDTITEIGAKIFCNKKLGDNLSYNDLKNDYDSVILTIGSQKGTLIGCEGEDAENVFSGIDFLKNMEVTGQKYNFKGKKIAVVGGGNTAMDCCRTSIRCNGDKVYVIYRRTEKEMPANPIEIHESKLEGVEYLFLTNPNKVNKDKDGKVKSITCLKMKLGEPDASGRRRPLPIEGSEYDIEINYILAAIGQKTDVNFIDNINHNCDKGELKINRWGDIDADPNTLQTGISSVFAAGDGVTGAATIIEAVAQAKIASLSCHQYLSGLPIEPEKKEFLSIKDNFKNQVVEDYKNNYANQDREEMPVLDTDKRHNFNEVELGYANEEIVKNETHRCLECGCTEYFTCDLKKYSNEYEVEQNKYSGEYKEYRVDFSHPYIEIDNNKCILCSRCVRICKEVVGANALGLINRGFDTYVAPSMGDSLTETTCESCGLCISACPTGAITENFIFKPGPVKLEKIETICNYCSVGCKITIHHKNNFVMKVTGSNGFINKDGNICKYAKFGYLYLNDNKRITKPLFKKNGEFKEISFDEAYEIITDKIKSVKPDENSFYAGARLSNEEMYLVQKLARVGAKTNNINNFHYMAGGPGYIHNSKSNVPFDEIKKTSKIYLLGSEINKDNAVAGFMVNNAKKKNKIPVELITTHENSSMKHKVDNLIKISSYYYFVKAVNYYLLSKGFENGMFIKDNTEDFENYKNSILKENFEQLVKKSGVCCKESIIDFAESFNKELNAVIIFSEKEVSPNTSYELFNLAMITGKLGKTANGLISLKQKNNSQGIFDIGICSKIGVGTQYITDKDFVEKLKTTWKISEFPNPVEHCQSEMLDKGAYENLFIFGEDPVGCAIDKNRVKSWFAQPEFVMVQDYFMSDTAKLADLILPASFPIESDGSFTNTQKVIQEFYKQIDAKPEKISIEQLIALLNKFEVNNLATIDDIKMEIVSLLPTEIKDIKYKFNITETDNNERLFNFACDYLVKYFYEDFEKAFDE